MPYQVLHVLGTAQPEGTGMVRIVEALAAGLDPNRYRLSALFLNDDGPLAQYLRDAGVTARSVATWRGARDPRGALRFWQALRAGRFDIVHIHAGGRSVNWLSRLAGARVVVHMHGCVVETPDLAPLRLKGHADAFIAVSQAVARLAGGRKVEVVYSGIPIPESPVAGLEGTVLGTAGRLVPIKGLVYLIRAMAELQYEFPKVRLEIAGSGPEELRLQEEAARLGVLKRVKFLEWQADLAATLARWDVFVHPSLEEGFGIAILEAMAAGLPVVATAVGGIPELVRDGETGWIVPPRDPNSLAQRLSALLRSPGLRRQMGAAGRTHVRRHFPAERMAASISAIYDRVLKLDSRSGLPT